jgi:hypothetical protein
MWIEPLAGIAVPLPLFPYRGKVRSFTHWFIVSPFIRIHAVGLSVVLD